MDTEVDVEIENHGSVYAFRPLTAAAKEWIEEHLELERWQWLGDAFVVDHRYARDLADNMIADDLVCR